MSSLTAIAVFAGFLLAGSGASLVFAGVGAKAQLAQVVHVLVGLLALIPMAWVLLRHRRTRGISWLGLASALALVLACSSGVAQLAIALGGVDGVRWLVPTHLWSSVVLGLLVVVHVWNGYQKRPAARWLRKWVAPAAGGLVVVSALVFGVGHWLAGVHAAPPVSRDYETPFGDKPFKPANIELVGTGQAGFVSPERLAGSITCGRCHAEIYRQWSESIHRYAATDPHVDIGIKWFQRENGTASGRFCAGCHNPIGLLAGWYDSSVTPEDEGTPPHDEGISCLVCHATTGIGEEPFGNASFHIRPPDPGVVPAGWLSDLLIRLDPVPHARQMSGAHLTDPRFCGTCHQQYIPEVLNGPGPEVPHNQFPEWLESKYADGPERKTCNDCHMPLVPGEDPASENGMIHSHRFLGANHAHAVAAGHVEQAEATLAFLREGVTMTLSLEEAQTEKGRVRLRVEVANVGVGHRFPSGTTDISETWIELVAGDPRSPHFASGLLDEKYYLDPQAHTWRTVYVDSANVPVDLHNLALVSDTTLDRYIEPGDSDTASYSVPLTAGAPFPVRARLRMRKANQRWNDWLFNFDGSTVPITDIHTATLTVDPATIRHTHRPQISDPTPPPPVAPEIETMVFVPGGPAVIGSEDGDADERPVRVEDVPSFYIDRFPVTNSQYRAFLRSARIPGPVHKLGWAERYNWNGQDYPPGTGDRPVVLVNHQEASDYCGRLGKRLPREVEWEKAARGPDGLRYPWGERWEDGACQAVAGMEVPEQVGLCPNRRSPYGVHEMVGGVLEWVADRYFAYDRTTLHPNANEWITTYGDPSYSLRGVPTGHVGPATTASSRAGHADNMRARIGFRCAKDGPKKGPGGRAP